MAIPKFNIPNLCGASPELNNALSKIADLKDSINVNINLDASAAAEALNSKLADVKAGLDGLAPDLPEIPNVNFQSELTSLVSDFNLSTPQGLLDFNLKKIELEGKFGDALTKAGKSFDSLISDATSAVSGGGDVCALAPNLELPAGVTAEQIKEGTAAVIEKAQGVKTALENAKDELPSKVEINKAVSAAKEAAKKIDDAVKSGTSYSTTTIKTNIITKTGKTTKATTSENAVTRNDNGSAVRATKSEDGITGQFLQNSILWYNPEELLKHGSQTLVDRFLKKNPKAILLPSDFPILELEHEPVEFTASLLVYWTIKQNKKGTGLVRKFAKSDPKDPDNLAHLNSSKAYVSPKKVDLDTKKGFSYIAVRLNYKYLNKTDARWSSNPEE